MFSFFSEMPAEEGEFNLNLNKDSALKIIGMFGVDFYASLQLTSCLRDFNKYGKSVIFSFLLDQVNHYGN